MTNATQETEKNATEVAHAEASKPVAGTPAVTHPPLPSPEEQAAIAEMEAQADAEAMQPMVDENLLEHTCYQLFDLYQKTGNHEVRRLAQLTVQGFAAVLGADPREFFPDAPPIRDSNEGGGGAPTYPGQPGQGWPQAQHEANSGGFVPTQPVVDARGQPTAALNVPMPAATGQVHAQNPSGAEMRVVSDPNGTMTGRPVNPQYVPPLPGQVEGGAPVPMAPAGPRLRRRPRR